MTNSPSTETETSSYTHSSTESTECLGSESPSSPLLSDREQFSSSSSPPRTVVIPPHAAPYAQLCFHQGEDRLVPLLIGTAFRPSRYHALQDSAHNLPVAVSPSHDDEIFDRDVGIDWGRSGLLTLSSSIDTCTSSSSSDETSTTSSGYYDQSPQEIIWLDESWLYNDDDASQYSAIALLHNVASKEPVGLDLIDADNMGGCGWFIRSGGARRKPTRMAFVKHPPYFSRNSDSSARNAPTHSRLHGKTFRYSVLRG